MEDIITPYVTDDNKIFMYVTESQLIDLRNAIDAVNKRRVLLRNKMAQRRDTKGTPTKPCKPVIKIDYPRRVSASNPPQLLPIKTSPPPFQYLSLTPQYIVNPR